MRVIFFIIFFISITLEIFAASFVQADPDKPFIGLEYSGVPSAKVGDSFHLNSFSIGGFLESRNETRFHQGVLPNHNWRGFAFLNYEYKLKKINKNNFTVFGGIEHESAHPTMGFNENNNEAYEMIYDDKYRNINLNSISLGISYLYENRLFNLKSIINYQQYLFSKNTPELHNTDLSNSFGMSVGFDMVFDYCQSKKVYISMFNRFIAEGDEQRVDSIYYDENGSIITKLKSYPILNKVNTIVFKTGIIFQRKKFNISLYLKLLYGNIFGFVDSREKRKVVSLGIEFSR